MNDATAVISTLPAKAARMLAVEMLLADPEVIEDGVLESCLSLLRERLREERRSAASRRGQNPSVETTGSPCQERAAKMTVRNPFGASMPQAPWTMTAATSRMWESSAGTERYRSSC
jgi:hypothetical protein